MRRRSASTHVAAPQVLRPAGPQAGGWPSTGAGRHASCRRGPPRDGPIAVCSSRVRPDTVERTTAGHRSARRRARHPSSRPRGDASWRAQPPKRRWRGGVRPQRAQEVDLAEVRPVGLAEVELRVRALPEQEPATAAARRTCGSPGRGRAGPWCRGARRCARRRGPRPAPRSRCPWSACSCSSERTASAISRRPP